MDEKKITVNPPINTQNDLVYSCHGMKRCVSPDRSTFSPGVMVSGFVSKLGKAQIVFVDEGAKINAGYYQNVMRKQLRGIRKTSGRKLAMQHAPSCCIANLEVTLRSQLYAISIKMFRIIFRKMIGLLICKI